MDGNGRVWTAVCAAIFLAVLVVGLAFVAEAVVDLPWLKRNPQQVLAFLGALFGFFLGTIVNHWLQLRRADRIRENETRALAAALSAQVASTKISAKRLRKTLASYVEEKKGLPAAFAPTLAFPKNPIYENNADKIGLLGVELAGPLVRHFDRLADFNQTVEVDFRSEIDELTSDALDHLLKYLDTTVKLSNRLDGKLLSRSKGPPLPNRSTKAAKAAAKVD